MQRVLMMAVCLLSVVALLSPWQVSEATPSPVNQQLAYQLLQAGDSEVVRALPQGDREILLAIMAMNQGATIKALLLLRADAVKANRLAALIRAEAYRRQSVQAAERAGHYAHAANDDIGRLKQARISSGLDEANQRLQAFMVSLNTAQAVMPEQLELHPLALESKPVAMPQAASKSVNVIAVTAWPSIVGRPVNAVATRAAKTSSASSVKAVKVAIARPVKALPVKLKPKPKRVKAAQANPRAAVSQQDKLKQSVRESLEMWRKDWQSRDSGAYLSHYHKAFETDKYNYKTWVKYKRRVNAKKSYIKVRLSHVKISPNGRYKKRGEVVLVTFNQQYKSSNYSATSRKKLYMARSRAGEPWLILREE